MTDITPDKPHADTLRHMAKDHLIAGNEHTADTLLAGATALDTLTKVQDVLDRLTAHADDLEAHAQASASTGPRIEAAGVRTALIAAQHALGGTP